MEAASILVKSRGRAPAELAMQMGPPVANPWTKRMGLLLLPLAALELARSGLGPCTRLST